MQHTQSSVTLEIARLIGNPRVLALATGAAPTRWSAPFSPFWLARGGAMKSGRGNSVEAPRAKISGQSLQRLFRSTYSSMTDRTDSATIFYEVRLIANVYGRNQEARENRDSLVRIKDGRHMLGPHVYGWQTWIVSNC
jgi:hypothetical protein